jgi:hypothetical protein
MHSFFASPGSGTEGSGGVKLVESGGLKFPKTLARIWHYRSPTGPHGPSKKEEEAFGGNEDLKKWRRKNMEVQTAKIPPLSARR